MRAGQIAVGFLKAEDKAVNLALCFEDADLFADILKAGQDLDDLNAELFRDAVGQVGGNDGLDADGVFRHLAEGLSLGGDIVKHQCTDFVAGKQLIVIAGLDSDTDAVAVGVGCQHQVGTGLFAEREAQLQCLPDFGVRIRAGREVAVGIFLFGNDGYVLVLDADPSEDLADRFVACAVQGRIDDLEAGGGDDVRIERALQNVLIETLDAVFTDVLDQAFVQALLEVDQLNILKLVQRVDVGQNLVGGLIGDLAAVGAVSLITVVLCGVMGCGDHDAHGGMMVTDRIGQAGYGHQFLININLDTVSGADAGSFLRENVGLDTGVVADGDRAVFIMFLDIVGNALGRLADDIDVHPVGAGADNAAQTRGTESQFPVKTVVDLLVLALNGFQFGDQVGVLGRFLHPHGIFFVYHDVHIPFLKPGLVCRTR